MQIHRLTAQNFRCFERFELPLAPGFNLLIGDNGAGKTALLDALRLGLGSYFLGFRTKLQAAPGFDTDDARRVVREIQETVDMQAQYPVRITCEGTVGGTLAKWSRTRSDEGRKTTVKDAYPLIHFATELQKQIRAQAAPVDLPVFAYYGTERLWLQLRTHKSALKLAQSRAAGYRYCLARESNIRYIAEWMKHRTMSAVQQYIIKSELGTGSISFNDVLLKTISNAVCSCIPGAKDFYYNIKYKELYLRFADQRELPFHLLSDGVRGMLQLVADLAWRIVVLNPHHMEEALRLAEGVVKIDELDLALHPRWQIHVINDLTRVFPKLQFVATTHSPLILAGAKGANVLLLEDSAVYKQEHVYGQDSNTVLTDNMGGLARPVEVKQQLDHVAKLIDEDRVADAKVEIARLEDKLGTDSTELVRLRAAIAFLHPPDREPADGS
jgi:predicted ATP-binding protein involved in virulence